MAIRIKSPKIHAMAKQLAHLTGKTQVGAIKAALEKGLAEVLAAKAQLESSPEQTCDE